MDSYQFMGQNGRNFWSCGFDPGGNELPGYGKFNRRGDIPGTLATFSLGLKHVEKDKDGSYRVWYEVGNVLKGGAEEDGWVPSRKGK